MTQWAEDSDTVSIFFLMVESFHLIYAGEFSGFNCFLCSNKSNPLSYKRQKRGWSFQSVKLSKWPQRLLGICGGGRKQQSTDSDPFFGVTRDSWIIKMSGNQSLQSQGKVWTFTDNCFQRETGLTKTLLQSGSLLHLHKQKHNRVFPKSSFKKSHKYLNLGCWYSSLLHKPWHFWTLGTICISYCYLSFSNGRFHLFLTFWPFSHHIQFIKWSFPPADRCCVRIRTDSWLAQRGCDSWQSLPNEGTTVTAVSCDTEPSLWRSKLQQRFSQKGFLFRFEETPDLNQISWGSPTC